MPDYLSDYPQPNPDLSPQDVVKIQLDALQNNDILPDDAGIRLAFAFASPENRAATGSLESFIEMVKNPLYAQMIGFERAELYTMIVLGHIAQQHVRLLHPNGRTALYLFTLSRQEGGAYDGCWMVDGVVPQG